MYFGLRIVTRKILTAVTRECLNWWICNFTQSICRYNSPCTFLILLKLFNIFFRLIDIFFFLICAPSGFYNLFFSCLLIYDLRGLRNGTGRAGIYTFGHSRSSNESPQLNGTHSSLPALVSQRVCVRALLYDTYVCAYRCALCIYLDDGRTWTTMFRYFGPEWDSMYYTQNSRVKRDVETPREWGETRMTLCCTGDDGKRLRREKNKNQYGKWNRRKNRK